MIGLNYELKTIRATDLFTIYCSVTYLSLQKAWKCGVDDITLKIKPITMYFRYIMITFSQLLNIYST